MADGRPWYREPETFIAVAALVISISAVAVGLYEAALQRRHDRAEVWPHVEITTYTSPTGATLSVENSSIGPALIKSIVTVDGRRAHDWKDVLTTLLGHAPRLRLRVLAAERLSHRPSYEMEHVDHCPAQADGDDF